MTKIYIGNPPEHIKQWIKEHSKPQLTELCFTAEEPNSSVQLQKQGSDAVYGFNGLEYKLNDGNWTSYNIGSTITLTNVGDKVYMRAVAAGNYGMCTDYNNYHQFYMGGKIAASGNINTLLNRDPNANISLEGKKWCYYILFQGCTSLTQAPVLPATKLFDFCYVGMFGGCTALTQAPELPATTLAYSCYSGMFGGCTALTQAPALPATILAEGCYASMFEGCTALTQINMTNLTETDYTTLKNAYSTGDIGQDDKIHFPETIQKDFDAKEPLCFTSKSNGSKIGLLSIGKPIKVNLVYRIDDGEWTDYTKNTYIDSLNVDQKVYFKAKTYNVTFSSNNSNFYKFVITDGSFAASGSVDSLLDAEHKVRLQPYCYNQLFVNCGSLTQAPELPAMTLADSCYQYMFQNSSLTQAPALPATTLAYRCYYGMFKGCSSLTQAPELPATTLAIDCYSFMFNGCTSLTQAPVLPATTLNDWCYDKMFHGCSQFSEVHMKQEMDGVYDASTHGDTTKTVKYDLA